MDIDAIEIGQVYRIQHHSNASSPLNGQSFIVSDIILEKFQVWGTAVLDGEERHGHVTPDDLQPMEGESNESSN
jgi:hypothetical protein